MIKICEQCDAEFSVIPSRGESAKYCSTRCSGLSQGSRKLKFVCAVCGVDFLVYPSVAARGKTKYCSKKCKGLDMRGSKHHNWKGICNENRLVRSQAEFFQWRKDVFARDNWVCQDCGKRGGELHAHHVFTFAEFPEHRFDVWNGLTLCRPCHRKTHFGVKNIMETA